MESIRQTTIKGVFWNGLEKIANQGIRFLVGLVLARLLSPSDFGTVALLAIFFSLSETFIDSGFGTALIRKLDRTETDYSTVFIFNIVISVVLYGILFLIAPWVAVFFDTPILAQILRVQSICVIFGGMMAVLDARLIIALNFKALAIRSFTSSVISGIVGICLAYLGYGIWALVFQAITLSFVNMLYVWIYCKWCPSFKFSWDSFKELFSYGSKLLTAGLLNTVYNNLTPLAIGKVYTSSDLGYYNRGAEFARLPNEVCLSVLEKVTFPIFSNLQKDIKQLVSVYRKYIKITSMFLIFFSLLLCSLAKPVILLLLTDKWADAVIYLQLFCFAVMFNHINSINLSLLKVSGRSDLFLRLEVIKKTVATLILFCAIPFGVIAICISKIIYDQVAIVINTYYSGRLFGMGYFSQLKDFIGYFGLSLISCLPAYLITYTNLGYLVQIIFGSFISVALYSFLLHKDTLFLETITSLKDNVVRLWKKF